MSVRLARFAALAALVAIAAVACGRRAAPPNVVLVVIDTLRADHMTLYGYERETTPAIAAWAARGTVFDNAWSGSSWTIPSMAMLFSGRVMVGRGLALPPETTTARGKPSLPTMRPLAESLRAAGYRTGAIVANPLLSDENGFTRGFEHYEVDDVPRPTAHYHGWSGAEVVRRGLAWLGQRDERPFFLFLHFFDPHFPYGRESGKRFPLVEDAERMARFRGALAAPARERLSDEVYRGIELRIAGYDSDVAHVDQSLGVFFERLEADGLADDTLVVLTADHGEGLWQRANAPDTPLKNVYFPQLYSGHGEQVYTEQVRVPLVLRGPGVPSGVRDGEHVSLLDLYPTVLGLLGLTGVGGTAELDGRELLPARARASGEIFSWCAPTSSITVDGRWRLHWPAEHAAERGRRAELFDLATDPLELAPLLDTEREASLRSRLEVYLERGHSVGRSAETAPSPRQIELLQALGYAHETE